MEREQTIPGEPFLLHRVPIHRQLRRRAGAWWESTPRTGAGWVGGPLRALVLKQVWDVSCGCVAENLKFLLPQETGQWGPVYPDFLLSCSPSPSPLKEPLVAPSQPCLTDHLPHITGPLGSRLKPVLRSYSLLPSPQCLFPSRSVKCSSLRDLQGPFLFLANGPFLLLLLTLTVCET